MPRISDELLKAIEAYGKELEKEPIVQYMNSRRTRTTATKGGATPGRVKAALATASGRRDK